MNQPVYAINLASQPFRRERAQNALLIAIGAGLMGTLLLLIALILHERAQAADLRQAIGSEQAQLQRLNSQSAQFSNVLGKSENANVFSRSVFLNEVIARRAVSWTIVFRDLETTLPPSMRLMSIRLPQVAGGDLDGTNHVQLDMILGTDHPETLIELLKRLQLSKLFGSAQLLGQQPPTQNDPLYKYRVTVTYAQKL